MDAIRIYTTVEQDGEIRLTNLPLKRGQRVEMIVLPEQEPASGTPSLTAETLLASELIGLWEGRDDLGDSSDYARNLRERARSTMHQLLD